MYIKLKKAKQYNAENPASTDHFEILNFVESELSRCGKYHYQKYPNQIVTLRESLDSAFDRVIEEVANGEDDYSVGITHFLVSARLEGNSLEVNIRHNIL